MSSVYPQGFTAIRVRETRASLLCDNAVTLIEVYAGCPCNRYLKFHYPYSLTPQDVLTGNPKDNLNQALLYNLGVLRSSGKNKRNFVLDVRFRSM